MISDDIRDALDGTIDTEGIVRLLSAEGKDRQELYAAAREVRERNFGTKIFTYGFVYFSTHCKNNCSFCYYRRSNTGLPRYRKSLEEIVQLSGSLKDSGINMADLTMGEDPLMYANGYEKLLEIIRSVRDEVGIPIMASPGAMPKEMFPVLRDAGADWFACYQETYDRGLFSRMRLEQDYEARRNQKIWSMEAGLLAEDGMMVGLGETVESRAITIRTMGELGCQQIRAMTFVPQDGTPMEKVVPQNSDDELNAIAVMRIMFPDRLIPASLDVEGIAGLRTRLDAGANVITSIVPPYMDLAGVAQHDLDIDNGHRSVEHVMNMLSEMGYRPAKDSEFRGFMDSRRRSCRA